MLRWLIVVILALALIEGLMPWLRRLGWGRLPGDLRLRLFGREWRIPVASVIVLSLLLELIARLL